MRREHSPLPDDPIYRAILFVLMASVVVGAVLALAGELVLYNPALSQVGGSITVVCGAIYFIFRWLGRREARRREAASEDRREAASEDRRDAWNDFDERNE